MRTITSGCRASPKFRAQHAVNRRRPSPIGLCQDAGAPARGWSRSRSAEGVALSVPQLPRRQAALLRTPAAGLAVATERAPPPGTGRAQRQPKDGFSRFAWTRAVREHAAWLTRRRDFRHRRRQAAGAESRPPTPARQPRAAGGDDEHAGSGASPARCCFSSTRNVRTRSGWAAFQTSGSSEFRSAVPAPVAPTHRADTPTRPDRAGARC